MWPQPKVLSSTFRKLSMPYLPGIISPPNSATLHFLTLFNNEFTKWGDSILIKRNPNKHKCDILLLIQNQVSSTCQDTHCHTTVKKNDIYISLSQRVNRSSYIQFIQIIYGWVTKKSHFWQKTLYLFYLLPEGCYRLTGFQYLQCIWIHTCIHSKLIHVTISQL